MIPITYFKDIHRGAPVAVCGGGPSLPDDLKRISDNSILIAVNNHALKIARCHYVAVMDEYRKRNQEFFKDLEQFEGFNISQIPEQSDVDLTGVDYWDGGITGTLALWFACYTGAAPIILCGFDCYQGDDLYFHDEPISETTDRVKDYPLDDHLKPWQELKSAYGSSLDMVRVASGPLVKVFPLTCGHPVKVFPSYLPRLSIDYDYQRDILNVDGVNYSGDVFRTLAIPDMNKLYSFRRDKGTVWITDHGPIDQLKGKHSTKDQGTVLKGD